jgi:methionine-rich copper-binding protein CopC
MKGLLLAGLLALAATPALAHSGLDATAPMNGAMLAEAPPHIVLIFAKRTRLTRVRMAHGDNQAVDVDLGDQTSFATRFVVPLTDMGSGLYRIELRGLSSDGHPVRNAFTFRVQ